MERTNLKHFFEVCACSTILLLSGCATDPLSKQTIDEIKKIGEVSLDDEKLITELEETYSEMTEKQKNQVKNYVDLKNARKTLDQLKEQAEKEGAEKQRKAREDLIATEPYRLAIESVSALKESMNNPASLSIESVIFFDATDTIKYVGIDFMGENSMGGTVSESLIVEFWDGEIYDSAFSIDQYEYQQLFEDMTKTVKGDNYQKLSVSLIEEFI